MCISKTRTDCLKAVSIHPSVSVLSSASAVVTKTGRHHREHLIVQHNYHDHAADSIPSGSPAQVLDDAKNTNNIMVSFPLKLYEMLESVEPDGYADIVSWQPHGRCFVVHKPDEFKSILPRYFKLSKVASFQRQLNLYGFIRLTRGSDKGGYYNELFLRGKPWLTSRIQRIKVKGTGVRAKSNPAQEPDFWSMPWVSPCPDVPSSSSPNTKDCASVVSHDEEEQQEDQSLPLHEELEKKVSLKPFPLAGEPEEDTIMVSWGMPFHYLPHRQAPPALIPSAPWGIDDDIDQILGGLDFEQVMKELIDNKEEESFADLLDKAIR